MDDKEIDKIINRIAQKILVSIFLFGGLTILAISVIFFSIVFSPKTWKFSLILVFVGAVMSVIGWRLKKKYQISFS